MANSNLNKARKTKNDEFYTQYNDIAEELSNYTNHFENKIVFCNCDDPEYSKFWQYFETKFSQLKLKKLISTHYNKDNSPSYALIYEGEEDSKGNPVTQRIELKENGDFRSEESIAFLKESDIVVTNPPFSLFREYIAQLMEYEKKFLVIGNKNAITHKEIFPLIKNNKIWWGYTSPGSEFKTPNGSTTTKMKGLCRWFTNLDHKIRHRQHILLQDYNIDDYPKYDNYDAINVDKVSEIPSDYYEVMGVPITFMDKYCPEQFEIIGCSDNGAVAEDYKLPHFKKHNEPYINGKKAYKRIFIKFIRR